MKVKIVTKNILAAPDEMKKFTLQTWMHEYDIKYRADAPAIRKKLKELEILHEQTPGGFQIMVLECL